MTGTMIETMESRTLMSATVSAVDPAVAADRLAVKADLLRFRADAAAGSAALLRDVAGLKANDLKAATTVAVPIARLKTDLKLTTLTLKADRLTQSLAVTTDQLSIVAELKQALKDKADPAALATDHVQLRVLRSQLQADDVAGLNARIADRATATTTIFNDLQTIIAATATDPNASAALKAAVSQFATDRTAKLQTLTTDLTRLSADRTQLSADLAAEAAAT